MDTKSIPINCPFLDRRIKLLPCQKEMVVYRRNQGESIKSLSIAFSVSCRTIDFILHPEKRLLNNQQTKERIGTVAKHYGNKYFADKIKQHRAYKKKLLS